MQWQWQLETGYGSENGRADVVMRMKERSVVELGFLKFLKLGLWIWILKMWEREREWCSHGVRENEGGAAGVEKMRKAEEYMNNSFRIFEIWILKMWMRENEGAQDNVSLVVWSKCRKKERPRFVLHWATRVLFSFLSKDLFWFVFYIKIVVATRVKRCRLCYLQLYYI